MGYLDILIIAVICVLAVFAVRAGIKRKNSGCGCCSMRGSCSGRRECK